MASPVYLRIAQQLPAVYQEDPASFAELDGFLGLVDDLNRAQIARLADLSTWLSPDATALWPPAVSVVAGRDRLLTAYRELLDEVARWFSFGFPASWEDGTGGVTQKRNFLLRAARLWRRRATPRGFLDWFCLYFGIDAPADRPFLLEHFKFGQPVGPGGALGPEPWLRASLLVPGTEQFDDYARRREALDFVRHYAPAHVFMRVCFVVPGFDGLDPIPGPGATPAERNDYRQRVRELLCSLVGFTSHETGIHLVTCDADGRPVSRPVDRLGIGRLPGGGEA